MAIAHRLIQFRTGDFEEVKEAMAQAANRTDGSLWLRFQPWVDDEHMPVPKGLAGLFSSRGPQIPEATWIPAQGSGNQAEPTQVGIRHATGPGALDRLTASGVRPPSGWKLIQEHTKRGLVFGIPPGDPFDLAIDYVLGACAVLAMVPTDDRWTARVSDAS